MQDDLITILNQIDVRLGRLEGKVSRFRNPSSEGARASGILADILESEIEKGNRERDKGVGEDIPHGLPFLGCAPCALPAIDLVLTLTYIGGTDPYNPFVTRSFPLYHSLETVSHGKITNGDVWRSDCQEFLDGGDLINQRSWGFEVICDRTAGLQYGEITVTAYGYGESAADGGTGPCSGKWPDTDPVYVFGQTNDAFGADVITPFRRTCKTSFQGKDTPFGFVRNYEIEASCDPVHIAFNPTGGMIRCPLETWYNSWFKSALLTEPP
jgi:hypothetical protein